MQNLQLKEDFRLNKILSPSFSVDNIREPKSSLHNKFIKNSYLDWDYTDHFAQPKDQTEAASERMQLAIQNLASSLDNRS